MWELIEIKLQDEKEYLFYDYMNDLDVPLNINVPTNKMGG